MVSNEFPMFMVSSLLIFFIFFFTFCRAGDTSRCPPPLPAQPSGLFGGAEGCRTRGGTGHDEDRAGAEGAAAGSSVASASKRQLLELGTVCCSELVAATGAGEQRASSGRAPAAAPRRAGGSRQQPGGLRSPLRSFPFTSC